MTNSGSLSNGLYSTWLEWLNVTADWIVSLRRICVPYTYHSAKWNNSLQFIVWTSYTTSEKLGYRCWIVCMVRTPVLRIFSLSSVFTGKSISAHGPPERIIKILHRTSPDCLFHRLCQENNIKIHSVKQSHGTHYVEAQIAEIKPLAHRFMVW